MFGGGWRSERVRTLCQLLIGRTKLLVNKKAVHSVSAGLQAARRGPETDRRLSAPLASPQRDVSSPTCSLQGRHAPRAARCELEGLRPARRGCLAAHGSAHRPHPRSLRRTLPFVQYDSARIRVEGLLGEERLSQAYERACKKAPRARPAGRPHEPGRRTRPLVLAPHTARPTSVSVSRSPPPAPSPPPLAPSPGPVPRAARAAPAGAGGVQGAAGRAARGGGQARAAHHILTHSPIVLVLKKQRN